MHPDQRTAEKAKAMLAKMSQQNGNLTDAVARAQHSQSPETDQAETGRAATFGRPAPVHRSESQYTPSPSVTSRGEQLPFVVAGQASDGIPLPAAEQEHVIHGRSLQAVQTGQSPFHTVSYEEPGSSGRAAYSTGQPPQWNGPAAQASGPSDIAPGTPQDPPNWRARKD
jgi:hypothetical protein